MDSDYLAMVSWEMRISYLSYYWSLESLLFRRNSCHASISCLCVIRIIRLFRFHHLIGLLLYSSMTVARISLALCGLMGGADARSASQWFS